MKLSVATLLIIPAMAAAFIPVQPRAFVATSLSAAKAAKSKEEDLELTRQVIAKFMGDDVEEEKPAKEEEESTEKEE